MVKWIKVVTKTGEQLITVSSVVSVIQVGQKVTLVTASGAKYDWLWDGKGTSWAAFIAGLEIADAI